MKILFKLVSAFLLLALLLGLVGYRSISDISAIHMVMDSLNRQAFPAINSLNAMKVAALFVFSSTSELVAIGGTPEVDEREMEEISEGSEDFNESFREYVSLEGSYGAPKSKPAGDISEKWAAFSGISRDLTELKMSGAGRAELFLAQQKFEASKEALLETLDAALSGKAREAEEKQGFIETTLQVSLRGLLVPLWLFVLISAAGIIVSASVSSSIMKLREAAERIGQGELGTRTDIASKDEVGVLASAFNKMAGDLKKSRDGILEREADLRQKVDELTGTKKALLNMMEDAEELNAELVKAEGKLKENVRALREADVKKNQFMSIAAHELKTPLTSIRGFSQLLREGAGNDAEKRRKYLEIMGREAERLSKLVTDILDLSRIDLGVMKFNLGKVDVAEVAGNVKQVMDIQVSAKGLDSSYEVEEGIPKIVTDRERITQILLNLIGNSVKYTPKGKITVKAFTDAGSAHFLIQDTGIGIPKRQQAKIFTRFYQADSSYTRRGGGVGLGLALCKELVELLGGRIWFESAAGAGTTFHFTLPLKRGGKENKYGAG